MKVVVQRVARASVTVGDREVSSIGKGICVLLGIARDDTIRESEWMARKLLNLRLFENPENDKPWDRSVKDLDLEVLCVSQFTLCHVLKGNKPDFHNALTSEQSEPMYREFLKMLGSMHRVEAIKGGEFGAVMQVHIQNDGPITLQFETPNIAKPKERKPPKQQGSKNTESSGKNTESGEDTKPAAESSAGVTAATGELKIDDSAQS